MRARALELVKMDGPCPRKAKMAIATALSCGLALGAAIQLLDSFILIGLGAVVAIAASRR